MASKKTLNNLFEGNFKDFVEEIWENLDSKLAIDRELMKNEIAESLLTERTDGHNAMIRQAMAGRSVVDYPVPGWDGIDMSDVYNQAAKGGGFKKVEKEEDDQYEDEYNDDDKYYDYTNQLGPIKEGRRGYKDKRHLKPFSKKDDGSSDLDNEDDQRKPVREELTKWRVSGSVHTADGVNDNVLRVAASDHKSASEKAMNHWNRKHGENLYGVKNLMVHKEEVDLDESCDFKPGDRVRTIKMGQTPGVVVKVDGDTVHYKVGSGKFGDKIWKSSKSNLRKEELDLDEDMDVRRIDVKNKKTGRVNSVVVQSKKRISKNKGIDWGDLLKKHAREE